MSNDNHRDLHGYYFEDLELGMTAVQGKTLTDADVLMFTGVSGDTNPLHQNREFASKTQSLVNQSFTDC